MLFRRFKICGDDGMRDTPVSIPNTEVKPHNADGTRRETSRETRKSPNKQDLVKRLSLFLYNKIKNREPGYC